MRIFYALLLVCCCVTSFAQTAYYDAKVLRRILGDPAVEQIAGSNPVEFQTLFAFRNPPRGQCAANPFLQACEDYNALITILRRYGPPSLDSLPDGQVLRHYKENNPYFKPLRTDGAAGGAGITGLVGRAVSSIGGIDVTTFADGLAQFLVERTKEELNVAFFEKLKKLLEKYPEFEVLFPNTNVFLNNFESWQYNNLINTLREGLDKDLKQILSSLIDLRNISDADCPDKNNNCKNRLKELGKFLRTDPGRILLSALQLGNALQGKQKWPDAINSIATPAFLLGHSNVDLQNAVRLINVFSMSLRSNEVTRHYVSKTEFDELKADAEFLRLYLGLIYEQAFVQQIRINNVSVVNVLSRANSVLTYLLQLQETGLKLQKAVDTLQSNQLGGKATPGDYLAVFDATSTWLKSVYNFQVIDPTLQTPPTLDDLFRVVGSVSEISHDILVKNYSAAIMGVLKIVDDGIASENTTTYQYLGDFKASFLNYASFGANVVNADSPDEVKEAIKSIAQPSGSSSVKKNSDFNIALNAYVGFVRGYENPGLESYTVTDDDGNVTRVKLNGGKSLAVYAPVGITLSKGMLFSKKNPWSASLFLSFIDVGALVGYRFTNDSTTRLETKVKLANIFAPGANLSIGLPWVPVSIGYGIQYIPSMQRDGSTNTLYNVDYSGRRDNQFFIAVDIPIINFYTGKKYMLTKRK